MDVWLLVYDSDSIQFIQMTSRERMKRKEVDDVLGGEEAWKNADSTASTSNLSSLFSNNVELELTILFLFSSFRFIFN